LCASIAAEHGRQPRDFSRLNAEIPARLRAVDVALPAAARNARIFAATVSPGAAHALRLAGQEDST
jgi:hypothetical protein